MSHNLQFEEAHTHKQKLLVLFHFEPSSSFLTRYIVKISENKSIVSPLYQPSSSVFKASNVQFCVHTSIAMSPSDHSQERLSTFKQSCD